MRGKLGVKSLIWTLIVSLMLGLAPASVWAEAAQNFGNAISGGIDAIAAAMEQDSQEPWADDPNRTETPQFYSFEGDQILEKRPDMGEERGGAGGANLQMSESKPVFPADTGKLTLSWTDTLQKWIDSQEGEPVGAPGGYTVTVDVKEIHSGKVYTLVKDRTDASGTNEYIWNGKDAAGNPLPDGFYYWRLQAEPLKVGFKLPPAETGGAPVFEQLAAPAYSTEYQIVVLDRTGPEIIGIHPLGGNRVAVEARDLVGGLRKLIVQGSVQSAKEWTDSPLRAAVSVQPGDAETLSIKVEDIAGNQTEESLPLYPFMTGTGSEDYVPNAEATVAGQNERINLATGNGIQTFRGLTQQGPGVDLDVYFTYNHQNRLKGPLGYGWSFNLDSRLSKWEGGDITWQGFDGTLYWFKPDGDGYDTYVNGQRQYYPHMTLDPNGDNPDDQNAFVMEWPDQLRYRFKNDGRFWLIQDRNQNEIFFSWIRWHTYHGYDNRIQSVKDTNGHLVEFQYQPDTGDLQSTVISELDGLGNTAGTKKKFFFLYNAAGEFVGYRDPSQKITRFVYDDLHRLSQVIDNGNNVREESGATPESVVTGWAYDDHNRVTRMGMTRKQDGQEEFVAVQYGTKGAAVQQPTGDYTLRWNNAFRPVERTQTVMTSSGTEQAATRYEYSANNLIRETDPLGAVHRYRYNDQDNVIAEQSPSGRIVRYDYDEQQDLVRETGPLGHDVAYTYVKNGRGIVSKTTTVQAVDPVGVNPAQAIVTKEEYDAKGLLVKRTDGAGNVFDYTYDENGFLTSDGTRVSYENDMNGNPVKVITDAGTADAAETDSTYNNVGWLLHRDNPSGLIEDFEYDDWGRETKRVQTDKNDTAKSITRTFRYDDGGHLTEESDGLTKTTYIVDGAGSTLSQVTVPLEAGTDGKLGETFVYDSRGLVVKHTDIRGETTETQYDLAGNPVKTVVMPDNITTSIEYDTFGRQKAATAADGGRTEYVYDAWDRVAAVKQFIKPVLPDNISANSGSLTEQTAVTNRRYDSAGRLIEEQQPSGSWTRYVYNGNGQVAETATGGPVPQWNGIPLPSGTADTLYPGHEVISRQKTAYDKLGRTLSVTDGNGNITRYRYEGRTVETLTPALDESGKAVVYSSKQSYSPDGRPVRTVSESGNVSAVTYDAFGQEIESVNEEGQKIITKSDAYGRVSERVEDVDRSGATQTIRYATDAWGNVREEQRQLSGSEWAKTTYSYTPDGRLKEETSSSGLVTTYAYDPHGLLLQSTEQNNTGDQISQRVTRYDYDAMGRQVKAEQPDGSQQVSVYDTSGREVLSFDGLNNITENHYDLNGQPTETLQYKQGTVNLTPANVSALTRYVYDGAGNTVLEKDPNGNIVRSAYDAGGNLTQEIHYENSSMSGAQIVNRYAYDPRGLMTASTDGNGHTTTYTYDAEGQQTKVTDPAGKWVKNDYSPAGFVTAERRPLGRDTEWVYDYRGNKLEEKDALGKVQRFSLDLDGRTQTEVNRSGETTKYSYDTAGRMTRTENPDGGVFAYRYDSAGNKLEEVRPVYGSVRYSYDQRDSLTSVVEPQTSGGELKTEYTYDAELNRTSQIDGNAQQTTYDYDELGRRLQKVVVRPESGEDVFEYQYDANGNVVLEKKPGGLTTKYAYDFMNRKVREEYSDGTWYSYTYDKAGNMLTRSGADGTIEYSYYDNNQLKQTTYPNGDTLVYEYNENGEKTAEIANGIRTEYQLDAAGRPTGYTDSKGYKYEYEYDADGYVKAVKYPNGTVTAVDYKAGHLIGTQKTSGAGQELQSSGYTYNARQFITGVQEQGKTSGYAYNDREQLDRIETPEGDVIQYEYDGAGNRTVRKAIIQGTIADKQKVITTEELVQKVLASFGLKSVGATTPAAPSDPVDTLPCKQNGNANGHDKDSGNGNGNGGGSVNGNGNGNGSGNGNSNGNSSGNGNKSSNANVSGKAHVALYSNGIYLAKNDNAGSGNDGSSGNGGGNGNSGGSDNSGGNGNSGSNAPSGGNGNASDNEHGNGNGNGNDHGNGNGNGNDHGNGQGNGNGKDNGQGNGKGNDKDKGKDKGKDDDKGNDKGNGKDKDNSNGNGSGCGWLKALEKGNGKKLGLYKKLGAKFGQGGSSGEVDFLFESGQMEHILAAIDNIVNGEVNLPPGGHDKLFERIREVGKGYTVIGTKYTYNTRNQLVHREDLIRYEEYDYKYNDQGDLLTDERSQFEWNARGQLTKVTFPDGFGEKYAYDMLGRRISKTQFNHQGETQEITRYTYKGDTWLITEERDGYGHVTKSYTFDANDRPLTITFKGQTFWYVYNGHGDVVALTDADGKVAARYEYDAWGLVTGMYNRFGERVREGIGWIGDLGTGNGSPGSLQGPEDSSGNTLPDYHPGNGKGKGKQEEGTSESTGTDQTATDTDLSDAATTTDTAATDQQLLTDIVTSESEPTADITTELVKENPFRYAGYYWDRKTQYYYLQARYYDPRPARFISEDSYDGEIENPLSLNLYIYAKNNPLSYEDPTGHWPQWLDNAWVSTKKNVKKYVLDGAKKQFSKEMLSKEFAAFKYYGRSMVSGVVDLGKATWYIADQYAMSNPVGAGVEFGVTRAGDYIWNGYKWIRAALITNKSSRYVRASLPKLKGSFEQAFKGKIDTITLKQGQIFYRVEGFGARNPGHWLGTVKPSTAKQADELFNIRKWGNPREQVSAYKVTKEVTVYYGRVYGGKGQQIFIPNDVPVSKVIKRVGKSTKLK